MSVSAADGTRLSVYRDTPVRPRPGGATVVLVHGASVTADLWRVHARHLTGLGLGVLRYDQRAHGHTPRGRAPLTIRQLADDLHQILTRLVPTGPLMLAGHSLGALVLQELAALHPNTRPAYGAWCCCRPPHAGRACCPAAARVPCFWPQDAACSP
ncbi:lysophospholipase [Streptomyces viridodiastaticus]|uniref:alpha/beta hydrolase n=1 Tax=Streptomyces albogriseolus TaxID=1887 RepID=UPI001FE6F436|nr:alpha/beta fold hydrolase [Streptomyces viridodiastaticus]MCX4570526.1 lysophospholipase [Streptomyces viridodiastaticus]